MNTDIDHRAVLPARRRGLRAAAALALTLAAGGGVIAAHAQGTASYPNAPVRLVVPYPAGSAVDQSARIIADELSRSLGQNFVIDNKPGASTIIGAEMVAKGAADGYTLLVTTNTTSAANKSLFKRLPYDPLKDFAHIGRMNSTSLILVVGPDLPVKDLRDFLDYARKHKPAPSAGYWSAGSQVAVATLKSLGGVELLAVPYKGSPPAVADLLGGQIALTFADVASALPNIKAGKLKGLAVTSPARSSLTPELPTVAEVLPGYDVSTWIGLVAPAGTPAAIVERLNAAMNQALAKPEVKQRFAALGLDVTPTTPAEFTRFVELEIGKWKTQLRAAGIEPQ